MTSPIYPHVRTRVMARRGVEHPFEVMVPSRSAVAVIDMQNHFMKPGAPAELPQAREIVPAINRLTEGARRLGAQVVWITTVGAAARDIWPVYVNDLMSPEQRKRREDSLDGEGRALWSGLQVKLEDWRVEKVMFSALIAGSSDLEPRLRAAGIDTLLIAGCATNTCCETTARDAMMLNFRTTMVSDGLVAPSDEEHIAALSNFYNQFGDVQTVDEALASLARGLAAT